MWNRSSLLPNSGSASPVSEISGGKSKNPFCNPVEPYALSKYNAELRAIEIARESGMALTILRLATLYGEGDPGNVGRLMRTLDRGRFLWIGDGSNRESLLYRGDAMRACMAVAERPALGINIYNVSAPACTMRDARACGWHRGCAGETSFPRTGSGVAGFASKSASVQETELSHVGPPSNCEEMAG